MIKVMVDQVERRLENIRKYGKRAKGGKELVGHIDGSMDLTPRQAMIAKCYDCMGYFADGMVDCKVKMCPLYAYMPYNEEGPKKKSRKPMSDEQRKAVAKRLGRARRKMAGTDAE